MTGGILQRLRWKWFLAARGTGFIQDYYERVYKIYLNHNKVAHYRDGYAVCSLSTPAVMSKPAANFTARGLYKSIQNRNLPNLMSFAVTDVCDAYCEHCSFFGGVDEKGRTLLSTEQAKKVIRDSQALGVSVINFVGGEPLLRQDLPEIIQSVDKDLSTTILFTNGSHLAERAKVLRKSGLDSVYVSIDSADPERNDHLRGLKGIFARDMEGIARAKTAGLSVGIACTMTPESFRAGELEKLIELGKRIGVHEVLVFDAMPSGRYQSRYDLLDNDEWIEQMVETSKRYNDDLTYPPVLIWAYATGHRSAGCACGTSYFYVSPYGDIMSCDFNHAKFGNVLESPLHKIWDYMSSLEDFRQSKWGGCKVKDSIFRLKSTVSGGRNNCSLCAEKVVSLSKANDVVRTGG